MWEVDYPHCDMWEVREGPEDVGICMGEGLSDLVKGGMW